MKRLMVLLAVVSLCIGFCTAQPSEKHRILISSDIGGTDADDNQSMLHLLMYSDLFDIEGLVSSPSFGDGSKEEILRMIDIYEKDFPVLQKHCPQLKTPDELRPLCKQGRHGLAPFAGYEKGTEGSDWIIECARRPDSRPLYVLVWGTLEDVAQALHDAPDIAEKIRIYWIGGPNKKFGVNSYAYIAENFPDLWMIENNASYRGLISNPKNQSLYHAGYYEACMKGAGNIGADFINYYKGIVKMGDTPSLLYMMHGNPDEPEGESWGGSFEKTNRSSRIVVDLTKNSKLKAQNRTDTVPVYSIVEFRFKGKKQKLAPGTPCFNLLIDKQNWQGHYLGKGEYCVRYSAKQPDTPIYEITSDNGAFQTIKGTLVVNNIWPGAPNKTDYRLGSTWWTDRIDTSLFEGKWQGAATVGKYRQQVLDDWAERLGWLKEYSNKKPRIIVLTDSEIDDRCSMAHLLFCSNDVEIAALIQTNSCFQRHGWSSEHWLEKQIDHYAEVYPNLKVHSKDFPSPDYLRSRIFVGDEDPAHVCLDTPASATQIGAPSRINPREWAATPGSEAIVKILLDNDPRPVFIQAWGGGSTAAKALQVIKDNHPKDYERAARKVVMYNIWYQDAAGNYIEQEHQLVTMLVSYHFHATWDYGAQNYTADFVRKWLHNSPSALARDYVQTNISEGDSPAFLYSLANGLRSHEHPTYGGWGGQFYKVAGMANVYRDTDKGSYSRWTEYVLRDFQSRLVWAVTPRYEDANHASVVTIREGLDLTVRSGERVTLTADVEDDGFLDLELQWQHRQYISEQKGVGKEKFIENTKKRPQKFETAWWQFYEAGTCHEHVDLQINPDNPNQVSFLAPEVKEPKTLHLVFQTTDNNKMGLTGFARVILTVLPNNKNLPK